VSARQAYPRRAEHNTVAEGGNRRYADRGAHPPSVSTSRRWRAVHGPDPLGARRTHVLVSVLMPKIRLALRTDCFVTLRRRTADCAASNGAPRRASSKGCLDRGGGCIASAHLKGTFYALPGRGRGERCQRADIITPAGADRLRSSLSRFRRPEVQRKRIVSAHRNTRPTGVSIGGLAPSRRARPRGCVALSTACANRTAKCALHAKLSDRLIALAPRARWHDVGGRFRSPSSCQSITEVLGRRIGATRIRAEAKVRAFTAIRVIRARGLTRASLARTPQARAGLPRR
jgi:hypothetical protein